MFCILLVLHSFIYIGLSSNFSPVIDKGVVIDDATSRSELLNNVGRITTSINSSIIICAEYFPVMCYLYENSRKQQIIGLDKDDYGIRWVHEKNLGYVYLASLNETEYWQDQGYKIYYMGDSAFYTTEINCKYNLKDYNCSNVFTSVSDSDN